MSLPNLFAPAPPSARKTVIIVGGGYAGVLTGRRLDSQFNVIIIDRKNYYLHNVASLRAVVQPDWVKFLCAPYDQVLQHGQVLQGEVEEIEETRLKLYAHDEWLRFDYLIIATGSSYRFPFKVSSPEAEGLYQVFREANEALKKATRIVILGGGPVGIELAGEIVGEYQNEKEITLVHAGTQLLNNNFSSNLRSQLHDLLKSNGVRVVLGERVTTGFDGSSTTGFIEGERALLTDQGTRLEADLVFVCIGGRVNSKSYEKNFAHVLTEDKRLKVSMTMQVEGYNHIFALGDCANADLPMAIWLEFQSNAVATNISRLESGIFKLPFLHRYTRFPFNVIVIPFGSSQGLTEIFGIVVGSLATSLLKGQHLFVSRMWGWAGQAPPKGAAKEIQYDFSSPDIERLSALLQTSQKSSEKLLTGLPVKEDSSSEYT